MSSRDAEKQRRREERLARERAAAAAARRRRLTLAGGVALVAVVAVVAVVVAAGGSGGGSTDGRGGGQGAAVPATRAASADLPGAQTGPPPWTNGAANQLRQRLAAIGLPALSAEGTVVHIHQHLDLFARGRRVRVPANIGIDPEFRFISPLHTHDSTGVIHVESANRATFRLGQLFGVWGVPLSATRIGGLRTGRGRVLRAWVNGRRVAGDPARIVLRSHEEIALAYGTRAQMPKRPPSRYAFAPGL
jgi:hypothetical protein